MATVIDELEIKVNSNGLDALLGTMDKLAKQFEKVGAMSKGFSNATAGVTRSTQAIGKSTEGATRGANKFFASIVRIAKYRLIRMALRYVTKAIKEGVEHFYNFSKASGESLYGFAAAMDSVKGGALTLKAQLGSAFAALLSALAPIINSLISLIIKLANAMSMVFAALGGGSKWFKAADGADALANSVGGAGGAAKEALRYLAPFDELNVLPKDSGGGGGGGGGNSLLDGVEYTEQDIPEWLQNFGTSLQISINDVFFNWDDLTPEQIAEKAIVGVTGLLGGIVGFILGGPGTAVTGSLIGVGIGILINSLVFNHDGNIDSNEIATLVVGALGAGVGGIFGAMIGGPAGALIGISLGALLTITITSLNLIDAIGDWKQKYIDENPDTSLAQWFRGEQAANAVITASADLRFEQQDALTRGIWDWIVMGHQPLESTVTVTPEINASEEERALLLGIFSDEVQEQMDAARQTNLDIGFQMADGVMDFFRWVFGGESGDVNNVEVGVDLVRNPNGYQSTWDLIEDAYGTGETHSRPVDFQVKPKQDDTWTTLGEWFTRPEIMGNPVEEAIGVTQGVDSAGRSWSNIYQWIRDNYWGGNLSKAVGIAQPNGNRWGTVYKWIRNNYWGDDLNKAIYIAQPNGKRWGTVASWIQNATNWGGSLFKEIGLTKQTSGDGAWTTVSAWIKKAKNWGETVIKRIIELVKGWKGTVTDWVKQSDNYGAGSAYVNVYVTRHVREVKDGQVGGGAVRNGATGGVFSGGVWRDINRYASGGILGTGSQLFWAREAGPELVGTLGGHTAVMNNDQIVASVSSGVARAMSGIRFKISGAATSGGMLDTEALYSVISRAISDNETDTEISLDGDVVYRKMLNRNRLETYRTGNNPMMTMA